MLGSEMSEGSRAKFTPSYSSKLPQADPAEEGPYPDEDIEEQTITEEEIGVLEEINEGEAEASEPDEAEAEEDTLQERVDLAQSLIDELSDKPEEEAHKEPQAHILGEGLYTLVREAPEEVAGLCVCGHPIINHPEGRDCIVADCECDAFEPASEEPQKRAAEVYRYEAPQQLMIPTMTADDKVGLIASQVQQVERLVTIMLAVVAVRKDDGTAPYDLWSKALEPAEDAQVLLQGVVKLLKTRNRNRY